MKAVATPLATVLVTVVGGGYLSGVVKEREARDTNERMYTQLLDRHFWVGHFDFPMMDNVQLPHGLRASVVVTEITVPPNPDDRELNSFASVHVVLFPAASASFKERQDYDDVMLRAAGQGELKAYTDGRDELSFVPTASRYTVRVLVKGWVTFEQEVTIQQGGRTEIQLSPKKRPG